MSGIKGRSGRKPNLEIQRMRELVNQAITDDDWKDALTQLATKMKAGDIKAFQILAAYRYGLPRDQVEEGAKGGVLVLRMPEQELHKRRPTKVLPQRTARQRIGPQKTESKNEPPPDRAGKHPEDSPLLTDY